MSCIPSEIKFKLRSHVMVKLNFRPYIRRYTSPNENFEYSYLLNQIFFFLLAAAFCHLLITFANVFSDQDQQIPNNLTDSVHERVF